MFGVIMIVRCCEGVAGIVTDGGDGGDIEISNELSGEMGDKVDNDENEESDDDDSESDSTWVELGLGTREAARGMGAEDM